MRLKAVIFDMDGVLSDTENFHGMAECRLFGTYGIAITGKELSRRFAGIPEKKIWPIIFEEFGKPCPSIDELLHTKITIMMELLKDTVPEVPGSKALIERAKSLSLTLGVASSSAPLLIDRVLTGLNVKHLMDAITSGAEVINGKPSPDIFLLAAKKLAADPSTCLVIEDARAGVLAGKAAGMIVIGYKTKTSEQDLSMADYVVQDLDEISEKMLYSL